MIDFPKWITVPAEAFVALPSWVILGSLCLAAIFIGWLIS